MKKLLLIVAALAIAAPTFAGTGGNPKPDKLAPESKAHWGSDQAKAAAKAPSSKTEKQAARSGK